MNKSVKSEIEKRLEYWVDREAILHEKIPRDMISFLVLWSFGHSLGSRRWRR